MTLQLSSPTAASEAASGRVWVPFILASQGRFEVLLPSFGLNGHPALERIGALIHYLDVGGVPVPEAAGLEALLRGARDALGDDDALLAKAGRLLDYLYAHYAAGA
jgi:hypothetical protein